MTSTNLKNNPNSSLLKDTRLSKGLSLDVVHESTKIPMDALRAIEEGYSTRILTPFYYRGFIKIYAEFLGLNVADVLKEYNAQPAEVKIASKVITKPVTTPKKIPVAASKVAQPIIVKEQFQEFRRSFWTPKTRKNLLRILGVVIALFILVKMVGCVANFIKSRPKHPPKAVVVVKKQKPVKKDEPKVETQPVSEAPVTKTESSMVSAKSQNHKVTLTVHASKDSFIQVKADGKVVFQMTMKKGTMENWEADDKIELSGKNIGDLDLEVNGKNVSPLGSANRKAKRVIITKEGLSVKK